MAKRPTRRCGQCGRAIKQAKTGRPPLWCGLACKQRAYIRRRLDAAEQAGRELAIEELRGRTYLA